MSEAQIPDWVRQLIEEGYSYEDIKDIGSRLLPKNMSELKAIEDDETIEPLARRLAEIFRVRIDDGSLLFLLGDYFKTISPKDIGLLYYGNRKN